MKNKGISLIVLIITVVVIIILATAIIVNLAQNNIIGNAKEATVKQDFKSMQEELNLYIADQFTQTQGKLDMTTIDADTTDEVKAILKSSSKSKYIKYVTIVDGKLVISESAPTVVKEWASEVISTGSSTTGSTITSQDIASNPTEYYGKEVEYVIDNKNLVATDSLETITLAEQYDDITWKVFYADEKNIYLIASDTLKKDGEQFTIEFADANEALTYLNTESNWSNLVNNEAEYAKGGTTLPMFVNSWNAKYPDNQITITGNDTNGWEFNSESYYDLTISDTLYWNTEVNYSLNSKAKNTTVYSVHLRGNTISSASWAYGPEYGGENQYYRSTGFRPVVCLKEGMVFKTSATDGKLYIAVNETNRTINNEEPTYKNPIIPAGFKTLNTDEAIWQDADNDGNPDGWNKGLVIEDGNGNEFVWVPVNNDYIIYNKEFSFKAPTGSFSTSAANNTDDTLPNGVNYEEEQIEKYGGFYIARYEAGVPDKTGTPQNSVGIPISQQSSVAWTNISYANAKISAEKMYVNDNVKSGLLTEKAYVTTCKWLLSNDFGVANESKYGNFQASEEPANVDGYGEKQKTGYSEYWKINNIYDLLGNVGDLTNCYTTYNDIYYIYRGSSYNNNLRLNSSAILKINSTGEDYIGFRVMLFIQ